MVVDKKTKVGEFIQFPLDYSDEQCLKEYGLTMDQYDDVQGYLTKEQSLMLTFMFQQSRGMPEREVKFKHSKQLALEAIAKHKKMMDKLK